MSSMKCGSTQQDVDQQPAFRVKLRVKQVVVKTGGKFGAPIRVDRMHVEDARLLAKMFPGCASDFALRAVGLRP